MVKILVVEDDQQFRNVLIQLFQRENYDVTGCSDGTEATKILKDEMFDVVITDIIMPKKDGMSLIVDLRRNRPNMRIIAISGGGRQIDPLNPLKIAQKVGAEYTFTKPFKLKELLGVVKSFDQAKV
jgi:DNA-binding response OmpR family regulator